MKEIRGMLALILKSMYYLNGLGPWGTRAFSLPLNDDENYVYFSPPLSQQIHQFSSKFFFVLSSELNPWKNKVSIHGSFIILRSYLVINSIRV